MHIKTIQREGKERKHLYLGTRTVYSSVASRQLEQAIQQDPTQKGDNIDLSVLVTTIRYCFGEMIDERRRLTDIRNDPRAYEGHFTDGFSTGKQSRTPLSLEDQMESTQKVRKEYYGEVLAPQLVRVDDLTERLGAAVKLLSTYLARQMNLKGVENADEIAQFAPEGKYVGDCVQFKQDGQRTTIKDFKEYKHLQKLVKGNPLLGALLEMKMSGAALEAALDNQVLAESVANTNVPDDLISEFVDGSTTFASNLGVLAAMPEMDKYSDLIFGSRRHGLTRFAQAYANHTSTKGFAIFAASLTSFLTGASLLLGVPQIGYWLSQKVIDLNYVPEYSIETVQKILLAGTSYGAAVAAFAMLTLGSDIGPKLTKSLRNIEWFEVDEIPTVE